MADPPSNTPDAGNKLKNSFKKHKAAWIGGIIVGLVLLFLIIRYYQNNSSSSNTSNPYTGTNAPTGTGGTGYSGDGTLSLQGLQGPAGPAGPPGKRGPQGPPGKPPAKHKKKVKTGKIVVDRNVRRPHQPPSHMIPQHTSGASHHPDASHARKSAS